MPRTHILVGCNIERTARLLQMEGLFDVPPSTRPMVEWNVNLPIEDRDWNIGLIVGPSGAGKSTVARKLFPDNIVAPFFWPANKSLLDGFPEDMPIKDLTALLSSVGFSSPPSWVRPFHVLSTGEQFRVTMARALAEAPSPIVVDEFTSVVDRTVAQIGAAALAKTIRKRKQKFVAVTCHFDVEAWLQPDWIYRPDLNEFQWRELQRRPAIDLQISRVTPAAWKIFARHHYLTGSISPSAMCFMAFWNDQPVAFDSYVNMFGFQKTKRGHRSVTLPDFQGVGIGNAMIAYTSSMWRALGYTVRQVSSHPGLIRNKLARPDLWRMVRKPGFVTKDTNPTSDHSTRSVARLTAGFEYVGPALSLKEARRAISTWASL